MEITSRDDAHRYVRMLRSREIEQDPAVRFWRVCKRLTLLSVLAASFLIYHFLSVTQQILEMPSLQVPVAYASPIKAPRTPFR